MADKDYKKKIEAILFSSGRFMSSETLMSLIDASSIQVIKNNIEKLKQEYQERDSPLIIVEDKNGWKINVREEYLPIVRKIVSDIELPKTVLETLAVIAWQAPVLQSKVVEIRHNKAYDHIKELVDLGFISKEPQGRSFMLKLRNKFFEYFEVDSKKDIRDLFKEIKQPEQKKVDEFEQEVYGEELVEGKKEINELDSLEDLDDKEDNGEIGNLEELEKYNQEKKEEFTELDEQETEKKNINKEIIDEL
jgi:segregation and condensation protein B